MTNRGPKRSNVDHGFALIWALLISVVLFCLYVAQDRSLIAMMLAADRSYLSLFIVFVFAGASCHAAWHIFAVSKRLHGAETVLAGGSSQRGRLPFLDEFLREVGPETGADRDSILEIYADRLRSPVEIGWFVVDILIRLGLVGTIIGFILILQSLTDGPAPKGDDIRSLLISMSAGMGTALYTTLAGLISATVLGIQYMILARGVEHLIGALVRIGQSAASPAGEP